MNARNCFFTLHGEDTEEPVWEGELGVDRLMEILKRKGAIVSYYDPHVPVIGMTRVHADWAGTRAVEWEEAVIRSFDVVIVATAHECVDYNELAAWSECIVDTRNTMAEIKAAPGQVWKA
jgi:UDP-N-acetyl-D-glucosamine dehydrogenase